MIKTVLLDLDGTVYEGNRLINGADAAVRNMRENGLKVLFCTNNSSKTPTSIAQKLTKMGIPCEDKDVISSGQMAIHIAINEKLKKIYFSGPEGLREELIKQGADLCDENHAENLIIAMDVNFNYEKMVKAVRAALIAKKIIVCNKDKLYPREDGLCPGCGAIVASILTVTQKEADLILGKPGTAMMEYAASITDNKPEEMIVIGDTEEADVEMAKNYGSPFVLITQNSCSGTSIKSLKDTINWNWKTMQF